MTVSHQKKGKTTVKENPFCFYYCSVYTCVCAKHTVGYFNYVTLCESCFSINPKTKPPQKVFAYMPKLNMI